MSAEEIRRRSQELDEDPSAGCSWQEISQALGRNKVTMNTSHKNIYYLDPWFIAREYEQRTSRSVPGKITRSSGGTLSGSLAGVISGSLGTQEVIEFSQTPEKTFEEISCGLNEYPEIQLEKVMVLPNLFWVAGILAPLGNSVYSDEKEEGIWTFSISSESGEAYIRLLADDTYFRYNIHKIVSHPQTLGSHFRPKVKALLKSHGKILQKKYFLATPLVIVEIEDSATDLTSRND